MFRLHASPEALGEPADVWRFESYQQLWQAFEASEALNQTFDALGEPTYSRIAIATDAEGYILFHLLILSIHFISRQREAAAIERVKEGLTEQDIDLVILRHHRKSDFYTKQSQ